MVNKLIIILVLLISIYKSNAQNNDSKFGYTFFVGYPVGIFSLPNFGYHVSGNIDYALFNIISLESQISFTKMDFNRSDNLFSHDGGLSNNFNLLVGLRLKFNKPIQKYHYYFNLLYGYGYATDEYFIDNNEYYKEEYSTGSISSSINLVLDNKLNFSFALEGPNPTFLLRAGYKF